MIDASDREIIRRLQADARLSNVELGRAVGLSPNAAGVRVQRLQEQGVIAGFHARIDHEALGRPIEASIDVWLKDDADRDEFTNAMRADERIVECFYLTGPLDFRVRARVASADDLNDLLYGLRSAGVRQTDSRLVLEQVPLHET